MGSWFSNLHIRKNNTITETVVMEYIRKIMADRQYLPAASKDEADGAFAILSDEESTWYSVYADLFSFCEPKQFAKFATPMSEEFKTDILGISCFDSDLLFLNLINKTEKLAAWVAVGRCSEFGIRKRSKFSAWENKVCDFDSFKRSVNADFDFAEDILAEIAHCIDLTEERSGASFEHLDDFGLFERAKILYFKHPEGKEQHNGA